MYNNQLLLSFVLFIFCLFVSLFVCLFISACYPKMIEFLLNLLIVNKIGLCQLVPSWENLKFSLYFSCSCIPINPKLSCVNKIFHFPKSFIRDAGTGGGGAGGAAAPVALYQEGKGGKGALSIYRIALAK